MLERVVALAEPAAVHVKKIMRKNIFDLLVHNLIGVFLAWQTLRLGGKRAFDVGELCRGGCNSEGHGRGGVVTRRPTGDSQGKFDLRTPARLLLDGVLSDLDPRSRQPTLHSQMNPIPYDGGRHHAEVKCWDKVDFLLESDALNGLLGVRADPFLRKRLELDVPDLTRPCDGKHVGLLVNFIANFKCALRRHRDTLNPFWPRNINAQGTTLGCKQRRHVSTR
mmetsp:Transcript_23514/g.53602  ORF Transcript_23514/g.53602 Transcript_23514/m.53602 type:complete len:222 (-) Transcript_23514:204-869(-)